MARQPHHDSNYGGARPGSGRPKGSGNKIRLEDLLDKLEQRTGQDYPTQLADNYANALARSDWKMVNDYDKAFMNKVIADKTEVEVVQNEDQIEARAQAFAEALAALAGKNL